MKRRIFLLFALLSLVEMLAISGGTNKVFGQSGTLNGHEYVDLGLPSGTKWATCNVGASNPHEYGDYFAWGETKPKGSYYDIGNYMYFSDYDVLPASADAATGNWGEGWRMPTKAEYYELVNNCKWTWLYNGYKVVGTNGNGIFLPAAGGHFGSELGNADSYGVYWSSSIYKGNTECAWGLEFHSERYDMTHCGRCYGLAVRPVCAQ